MGGRQEQEGRDSRGAKGSALAHDTREPLAHGDPGSNLLCPDPLPIPPSLCFNFPVNNVKKSPDRKEQKMESEVP